MITATVLAAVLTATIQAKPDPRVAAMSKLEMVIGDWHGKGWSMGRDGQKVEFLSYETMKREAGGSVFSITGRHWTVVDGREVPNYEAFGFLTYDPSGEGKYRLENHINGGGIQRFDLTLIPGGMTWKIGETIDVSLVIEDGKWVEQAWRTVEGEKLVFFEIVMSKK